MTRGMQWMTVLLLGIIAVLLTILVARTTDPAQQAYAQTSMGGERFIVATGDIGSNQAGLFLIDAKNETLSVYWAPNGQGIQYIGTRPFKYEVQVKRPLNDKTTVRDLQFDSLKKAFESGQTEDNK